MESKYLPKIAELERERGDLLAMEYRTIRQSERLLRLGAAIAFLWQLRRAELAGADTSKIRPGIRIGYERQRGRRPDNATTRWLYGD